MIEPKNPRLYQILEDTFGTVHIQSAGMPYRYRLVREKDNKQHVERFAAGEEYAVCCPKCGDTRYRLNVNHMFGARLPCGVKLSNLAHCWNENCDVLSILQELVEGAQIDVEGVQLQKPPDMADITAMSAAEHKKLYGLVPLTNLPESHPSRQYLLARNFDPVALSMYKGFVHCEDFSYMDAARRIIMPIMHETDKIPRTVVGWQARAVPGWSKTGWSDDPKVKATKKYATSAGCSRGFFLMGYESARTMPGVVVAEGPLSAFRAGFCGVASMGCRLTEGQLNLISSTWGWHEHAIVLLAEDPGKEVIREAWESNADKLRSRISNPNRVVVVYTGDDCDAADLCFYELWELIERRCNEQNVAPPIRGSGILSLS